ncbi:hypothetical protein FRC06_004106 [Ceratobasidium sp. 370]|nr:hypothetical protein FRC06_004106 [Ceratobasidium sp. 370]
MMQENYNTNVQALDQGSYHQMEEVQVAAGRILQPTDLVLPPTTKIYINQCHAIHFLLTGPEEEPTSELCTEIANYLAVIHKEFQVFHNGGSTVHWPDLCALERAPTVLADVLVLQPTVNRAHEAYQLDWGMATDLNDAVFEVRVMLMHLNDVVPKQQEPRCRSLYTCFQQHQMQHVPEPDKLRSRVMFGSLYRSLPELEAVVSETQLWLAFTPMFCSLMASACGLDPISVARFRPSMFRNNRLALLAHNWYMGLRQAPLAYTVWGV